jgi:hypothetical protein
MRGATPIGRKLLELGKLVESATGEFREIHHDDAAIALVTPGGHMCSFTSENDVVYNTALHY